MIFFSSLLDTVWTELSAWQQKTQNIKMLMSPVARGTLHRKISILQKMSFKQLFEVLLWLYTYVVTTKQLLCCEALRMYKVKYRFYVCSKGGNTPTQTDFVWIFTPKGDNSSGHCFHWKLREEKATQGKNK